jgi:hypothetical protein
MNVKLLFLLIVFAVSVTAETVYKTRDAEGNIIFSDIPSEGAETIEIQEAQTLNLPEPKRIGDRPTTKLTPEGIKYNQFKITSPENDSTIHSNEGVANIIVELSPELDEKHVIVIIMDGKEVSSGKSFAVSLSDIDRGTHNVVALIKDEEDKVLKRSSKLTFHLRKASKLFKNRTNENATAPDLGVTIIAPDASSTPPASPEIPSL